MTAAFERSLAAELARSRDSTSRDIWLLAFRAEGDGPDTALRVKAMLKAALRHHGLRCVTMGEIDREESHAV